MSRCSSSGGACWALSDLRAPANPPWPDALSLADRPDSGQIFFEGHDLWTTADRRALHARIQLIPQQPAASLNPRFTAVEIVAEPLAIQRRGDPAKRRELAERWMAAVGGRTPWSAADGDTGGETDRPANCTGGKTAGGTEALGGRTPWSAAGPLAGRQRGESGGSASGRTAPAARPPAVRIGRRWSFRGASGSGWPSPAH